jgi:hypothetical protein
MELTTHVCQWISPFPPSIQTRRTVRATITTAQSPIRRLRREGRNIIQKPENRQTGIVGHPVTMMARWVSEPGLKLMLASSINAKKRRPDARFAIASTTQRTTVLQWRDVGVAGGAAVLVIGCKGFSYWLNVGHHSRGLAAAPSSAWSD